MSWKREAGLIEGSHNDERMGFSEQVEIATSYCAHQITSNIFALRSDGSQLFKAPTGHFARTAYWGKVGEEGLRV